MKDAEGGCEVGKEGKHGEEGLVKDVGGTRGRGLEKGW